MLRITFQHTAARRRLQQYHLQVNICTQFQHTAARRRLRTVIVTAGGKRWFQHTAARRRLRLQFLPKFLPLVVSTHSRPKAAAKIQKLVLTTSKCFNTQPPEGGCLPLVSLDRFIKRFNTQPPEGGCSVIVYSLNFGCGFQHTAARRRLLNGTDASRFLEILFQHTAARRRLLINGSTNPAFMAGFNTQPPEGGCLLPQAFTGTYLVFQHTAARRRLPMD